VPRNVQVIIDFDRAIDALSADRITLSANGVAVRTALTLGNGDTRAILAPSTPLKGATIYTVTVGAVTDLSGTPIAAPVVTQFITGSSVDLVAPAVTTVTPSNGAQNVALDATVQLTFSERINRLSVSTTSLTLTDGTTGQRVAGDVVVSNDGRNAAFIPAAPLTAATTYFVQISGFVDLSGQQGSLFTSFRTTP
jgi:methionine-rich copper-binding protein CopC